MPYPIKLTQQPAQPTVVIHAQAAVKDLPRLMGEAYQKIMQYLGELGEHPTGMPFAAYHNEDMEHLELEIGFPVSKPLPGQGDIQPGELPGGQWATVLYTGPYDQCAPAYEALWAWVKAHGYKTTGVAYEAYCSEPDTPPQDTQTWIMTPVN